MQEANNIMSKLDFNNNGSIDYSEFMIANIDPQQLIKEDKLREIFDLFDVDHSGSITIDEIKKVLGGGGGDVDVDDSEWEKIVEEVDLEGDGEISFHEFKLMIYTLLGIPIPKNDQMLQLLKDEESPVYK